MANDKRGFLSKALGLTAKAATGNAAAAAELLDVGSQQAAGLIGSIAAALSKPIYTDTRTTTKTWRTSDGRIITETTTKGWTVPLGLPVLVVGSIALWEIGHALAKAFGISKGAAAGDLQDAAALMSPASWIAYDLATGSFGKNQTADEISIGILEGPAGLLAYLFGQKVIDQAKNADGTSSGKVTVKLPPTFMAAMSYLGIVSSAPLVVALNRLLGVNPSDTPAG